jgi:hypothetical protein
MTSDEYKNPAVTATDAIGQLNAWVDQVTARSAATRSRPGFAQVPETRANHLKHLTELCRGAGVGQPDTLADALMLLTEGVRNSDGPSDATRRNLNRICKATIAAFSRQ